MGGRRSGPCASSKGSPSPREGASSSLFLPRDVAEGLSSAIGQLVQDPDRMTELGCDPLRLQALKLQIDTALKGWLER
jgi:hypothetical protein